MKREGVKDEDDDDDDDDDDANVGTKKEPAGDTDEESDAAGGKEEDSEVRDLKYKLERLWLVFDDVLKSTNVCFTGSAILCCIDLIPAQNELRKDLSMHERNLRVRPVTFVFSKASWLICFTFIVLLCSELSICDTNKIRRIIFNPIGCTEESVYGKRDGAITGLAVIHRDRGNLFPSAKGFRLGVVHDVAMLPRAQMFKPQVF